MILSFFNPFFIKILNFIRIFSLIDRWDNGMKDYASKSCGIQSDVPNVFPTFPELRNKFKVGQK